MPDRRCGCCDTGGGLRGGIHLFFFVFFFGWILVKKRKEEKRGRGGRGGEGRSLMSAMGEEKDGVGKGGQKQTF